MLINSESSLGDFSLKILLRFAASFKKQAFEFDSVGRLLVKSNDLAGDRTSFL